MAIAGRHRCPDLDGWPAGWRLCALEPGGSFDNIPQDGSGEVQYTRGSVDLLTLFASFAAGGGNGDGDGAADASSSESNAGDDAYPLDGDQ